MFRRVRIAFIVAALGLALAGFARAEDGMEGMAMGKEAGKGTVDPVSGNKVADKGSPTAIFLDTLFHFESLENLAKFRAAPEKYATVLCPVSHEQVRISEAQSKSVADGRTWYFCCDKCKAKFDKDPAKYETFRCPISGETPLRSDPNAVTATIEGREVRFCCAMCKGKFEKNAAAYFAMMVPEGGIPPAPAPQKTPAQEPAKTE